MVSVTLATSAVIVRLVWEVTNTTVVGSLAVIILLILVMLGVCALLIYLAIKPSLKTLKSLPVRIGIILIFTAGIIDTVIHFIRFVSSPDAASPISVVIATLLLMAGISIYLLVLWLIWSIRRGGHRG